MKNTIIAPSVLAADFANLQRDIEMINNSQADWFHIDIMDGVFVPNISFGMPVLEAIAKAHNATPFQIALAWVVTQPRVITIPMSFDPVHIKENFDAAEIELTQAELEQLTDQI